MSEPAATAGQPLLVLGAATCEDTAIVVDRLRAIGAAYDSVDIDADPASLERVRRLNGGARITPTVIVGDEAVVAAEPSLEEVGDLLRAAGQEFGMPAATQLHGAITGRAIPSVAVPTAEGGSFSLGELRGKRQVALLLAHGPECLPCLGYARQLSRQRAALDGAGASLVVAVEGPAAAAAGWAEALESGSVLVGDPEGAWKAAVARHLDLPAGDAMLVLLDRYLAPRVVSHEADAGGLTDPSEATDWLRFIELECPECSGEIEWPEEG